MKAFYCLVCLIISINTCFAAKLTELKSKDGRSIQVSFDNYSPEDKIIKARINGAGSVVSFDMSLLDKDSQTKVLNWYEVYSVSKLMRFEITREPSEGDGRHHFKIEIKNSSNLAVKDMEIDYQIPYKENRMEVDKDDNSGGGKKKKVIKYKKITTESVYNGSITIDQIEARGETVVYSDSLESSYTQELSQGKDKPGKKFRMLNSFSGILLTIKLDGKVVEEIQSKPGVKQLVERYSK